MIYLTGDLHGTNGIKRLKESTPHLGPQDHLIVLGDFGCVWTDKDKDLYLPNTKQITLWS